MQSTSELTSQGICNSDHFVLISRNDDQPQRAKDLYAQRFIG
jgi:hypothetical protein